MQEVKARRHDCLSRVSDVLVGMPLKGETKMLSSPDGPIAHRPTSLKTRLLVCENWGWDGVRHGTRSRSCCAGEMWPNMAGEGKMARWRCAPLEKLKVLTEISPLLPAAATATVR